MKNMIAVLLAIAAMAFIAFAYLAFVFLPTTIVVGCLGGPQEALNVFCAWIGMATLMGSCLFFMVRSTGPGTGFDTVGDFVGFAKYMTLGVVAARQRV
jgi:hypothetical protein